MGSGFANVFNGIGALGEGIRAAKLQRVDAEQQQLGKLFQLYQLNEGRKNEARQEYYDRWNQLQHGAEPDESDLELQHRYDTARDYSSKLMDRMAENLGGKEGKSHVMGFFKGMHKAFGGDHEQPPELPMGNGGGGGMGSPSAMYSARQQAAQPQGQALDEVRAPAEMQLTPQAVAPQGGSQAVAPSELVQHGPTPDRPFAWNRYVEPKGVADIEREAYRAGGGGSIAIPREMVDRVVVDKARSHAQQLMQLLDHYVHHVRQTVNPDDDTFKGSMKDPNFAKLVGALENLQYSPNIHVNGRAENIIDPGMIQNKLKEHFPKDYKTREERANPNPERDLEAAVIPILDIPEGQRTREQQTIVTRYRNLQSEKSGGTPTHHTYNYYLGKGMTPPDALRAMEKDQMAGMLPPGAQLITSRDPITQELRYEVVNVRGGQKPEGKPVGTRFNIIPYMTKAPSRPGQFAFNPEYQARGLKAGESYLDVNKLMNADRANSGTIITSEELDSLIRATKYEPDRKLLQQYHVEKARNQMSRVMGQGQ